MGGMASKMWRWQISADDRWGILLKAPVWGRINTWNKNTTCRGSYTFTITVVYNLLRFVQGQPVNFWPTDAQSRVITDWHCTHCQLSFVVLFRYSAVLTVSPFCLQKVSIFCKVCSRIVGTLGTSSCPQHTYRTFASFLNVVTLTLWHILLVFKSSSVIPKHLQTL